MGHIIIRCLLICFVVTVLNSSVLAQVGEWTQCIAFSNNIKFNIVHGSFNADVCYALAKECTGDPNVRSQYYSFAVVIEPPYERCTYGGIGAVNTETAFRRSDGTTTSHGCLKLWGQKEAVAIDLDLPIA